MSRRSRRRYNGSYYMRERARSGRVFVDCISCSEREIIRVEVLDDVSDEEATKMFEERGWSVRPTLCPGCQTIGGA